MLCLRHEYSIVGFFMMHYAHQLGAYLFVLCFLAAVLSVILGLIRKQEVWLRRGAWGFIFAFILLCIPYFSGFLLKSSLLPGADEGLRALIQKHHDLSKFVLTGSILMFGACLALLRKYKPGENLPSWLWPNLMFLSWMVLTFVIRSLIHGYRIP